MERDSEDILAEITPVEQIIREDGVHEIFHIAADSQESAIAAAKEFAEDTGGEIAGLTQIEPGHNHDGHSGGRSIGFDSRRWNSPWEPKGPKPNWRTDSSVDDDRRN